MTIMLHLTLILLALVTAMVQLWGARMEERPCKYVKYSYSLSLFVSALFVFLSMYGCDNFGLYAALGLLLFNILMGGSVRLFTLRRNKQECPRL